MITEHQIERTAQQLSDDHTEIEPWLRRVETEQPHLLAYLTSDAFGILTEAEQELLLYAATIIYETVRREAPQTALIPEDDIGAVEERNWERIESSSARTFREKLDVFFRDIPQEDLLAFAEDLLLPPAEEDDESDDLTPEGRELIFVGLATVIEVLTTN